MQIICFSHLRWNFVYQRPQHLFSRFAKYYTVYFYEEPIYYEGEDSIVIEEQNENLFIVTPHLNKASEDDTLHGRQRMLVSTLIDQQKLTDYICWYYSPMMFLFSDHLKPRLVIYDCMDELSAFKFAPPQLKEAEKKLMHKAGVIFTGGYSLYEAKKHLHDNIYPFPSSIDKEHFEQARYLSEEPDDQKNIPHPRLGFFGVLDERFDTALIKDIAAKRKDWNFIFIGPVVKISEDVLPKAANIFYIGMKSYNELPAYLSSWDIATLPFAINESTQYISPTKTPEYLAAGKPVISTAIKDVVRPYGEKQLVSIVHDTNEFIDAAESILSDTNKDEWLAATDAFLANNSWNNTFERMNSIITESLAAQENIINNKIEEEYV